LLKKAAQNDKTAYKLTNALSPSLQYYRFSLLPSLMDKVHANIKLGYDKFALFEIGKGHDQEHKAKDGLPQEFELLSLVYTASSKTNPAGSAYYLAKQYLSELTTELGIGLKFTLVEELPNAAIAQPFAAGRAAMVSTNTGKYLGIIGEFKSTVRQSFKLPDYSAGFEIDIQALLESRPPVKNYQPLPRFPQTHQDLCLRATTQLSYGQLTEFLSNALDVQSRQHGYNHSIEALDIYQKDSDAKHKQTTWRIQLWHPERTLTTGEVNELLDEISNQAKKELNAERI
jgi:phenylalanyl-tRNA synthetase beta chain